MNTMEDDEGFINVAELTPAQWELIRSKALELLHKYRDVIGEFEYNALSTISEIQDDRNYLAVCDEYVDDVDNIEEDVTLDKFYTVLDAVIDDVAYDTIYAPMDIED